jgi:hypothetical protein
MANEFINASIRRMKYYKELGEKTFEQLNDADFHFNLHPNRIVLL